MFNYCFLGMSSYLLHMHADEEHMGHLLCRAVTIKILPPNGHLPPANHQDPQLERVWRNRFPLDYWGSQSNVSCTQLRICILWLETRSNSRFRGFS